MESTLPVSVTDVIEMVRIEDRYGADERFVAISPDGSRLATVIWRGDLERRVNLYSILVIDVTDAANRRRTVDDALITIPFDGDPQDQTAAAFDQLAFLADNRTLAFRGTLDGGPRQVHLINTATAELRTVSRHPSDVLAYGVSDDGILRVYAAMAESDLAGAEAALDDGVFPYTVGDGPVGFPFAALGAIYGLRGLVDQLKPQARLFAPADEPGATPVLLGDATSRSTVPGLDPDGLPALRGSLAPRHGNRPRETPAVFSPLRPIVVNGALAAGVVDDIATPPELAIHNLETGQTTVVTDLNPRLRSRRHGEAEQIRFATPHDAEATAWLVKPSAYEPGKRYPLIVLFSNEGERRTDSSYLVDGRRNLTGHAAQPLAGLGFMVLYVGTRPVGMGTPAETEAVREGTESAIRSLIDRGLVDPERIGISGFSRSAYYTEYMLMNSTIRFAAATQIDGGTANYVENFRPWRDEELERIRTPLLAQAHGKTQFAYQGAMLDRLRAMGRPVELLYFATAPHSTKQPHHRRLSLETHVDWWRFWLQDHEEPDPAKAALYRRWRDLRDNAAPDAPQPRIRPRS